MAKFAKRFETFVNNFKRDLVDIKQKVKEEKRLENEKINELSLEKKEQYFLFRKYFTIFFCVFVVALFGSAYAGFDLIVFLAEALIALVSYILAKHPPKKIKYPSIFWMPVIAFGCISLIVLVFWFITPSK